MGLRAGRNVRAGMLGNLVIGVDVTGFGGRRGLGVWVGRRRSCCRGVRRRTGLLLTCLLLSLLTGVAGYVAERLRILGVRHPRT